MLLTWLRPCLSSLLLTGALWNPACLLVLGAGFLADASEVKLVVTGEKLSVLLTAGCLESQSAEAVDGTDRLVLV